MSTPAAFTALPLDPTLQKALSDLGFTQMTPIQAAALPPLLAGRDLVGQSRTGSGKTAAFALPILQGLALADRRVQALVLCPTRELAAQVTTGIRALGRRSPGLRVVTVTGGTPGGLQSRALGEGAHVVVGTPGRTLDHLRRGTLDARRVRWLVLDEADRMLELGFADEMSAILDGLPADRQTALFSATFPEKLSTLTAGWLRDPEHVVIPTEVTDLTAAAVVVEEDAKGDALRRLLAALAPASALVFRNLKRTVAETAADLEAAGFAAAALHGDLEQHEREQVLATFRNGTVRVLVATDVAARGLDIAGLDLVVNADLPLHADDYVHRVGRTGRAGRPGVAWSLVTTRELRMLPDLAVGTAEIGVRDGLPDGPGAPLASDWATLRVGAGRRDKLRPGDLLGALTGDVGLGKDAVGKIEIHDRWAFVAIARGSADAAVKGIARHGVKGKRTRVERIG